MKNKIFRDSEMDLVKINMLDVQSSHDSRIDIPILVDPREKKLS